MNKFIKDFIWFIYFSSSFIFGILTKNIKIKFLVIPIILLIGFFIEKKLIILQKDKKEDFSRGLIVSLYFIAFLVCIFNIKINFF